MTCPACHTNPPYSLDLALSDFYLFLTVEEKFKGTEVADEDQFFESLQTILRVSIGKN
jgi:hypothetical protein